MVISKRRECKALCEKDRRNKIASQISLIAKVVPQDLLPPGFSQKDVLAAAYKFIHSVTSSTTPSCSKNGQVDVQIDESACLKQLPTSTTHVTYVITSESSSKPILSDQSAQTESCEIGHVSSSYPVQPNYVIMVQPTVLMDATAKKRKIDSKPPPSTYPLLPKPSTTVIDAGDILSQATAAILFENAETQTDTWPVPPEVTSTFAQTEETPTVTQNAACQTTAVNISENFQDIVDMVEEANHRQADAQFANRQKQPSGTGLRVENLLAPSCERPNQQHADAHSTTQRPAIWSQYPNFAVSSFYGQQEQATATAADAPVSSHPRTNATNSTNSANVHQSGSRFSVVDFTVAGVLRSDDASTSQIDQRSKLSHFANAEQRHAQQRPNPNPNPNSNPNPNPPQKQTAKRQTAQNRRQNTDKAASTCPQPPAPFIQPTYYPVAHQHPPLDATGERVDLSEDIFDYSAPTMDGNNWWYQRPAQAAQFWTNSSNSGYAYGSANANISWCPAPAQNTAMTSSTTTPQQQRQTTNNTSGREKTHAGFHIANMLPEISPMQHGQQQQPDSRDNARQQDSSRRHTQQPHTSHQYWSPDYALHGFGRSSYDMSSTNPYYRDPSVDDRTNFMPRFNL